jgi:CRP-like cAMP-binding protein
MNQIINTFSKFGFAGNDLTEIAEYFSLKRYKSGEFFIQNGFVADYLGFVNQGIFQFYFDDNGDEKTTYMALKGDVIVSVQSFFAGLQSKENVKALVEAEVWIIKKSDFIKLIDNISGFKEFYISVLEHLLVCIDESRFDYITLSPDERYAKLMKNEPELLQQVPLKYLSALIGITPRHLSRIRKNIK